MSILNGWFKCLEWLLPSDDGGQRLEFWTVKLSSDSIHDDCNQRQDKERRYEPGLFWGFERQSFITSRNDVISADRGPYLLSIVSILIQIYAPGLEQSHKDLWQSPWVGCSRVTTVRWTVRPNSHSSWYLTLCTAILWNDEWKDCMEHVFQVKFKAHSHTGG